jgi:dihydrofolate reductase
VFQQKFFRENLKLGEGGETGHDNHLLEETFKRTGVSIMGKRMFEGGERFWPEEAPFHTPVFVLTHEVRKPWVRPGGTTFHFVNDGVQSALAQARKVVGNRDIQIAGGAKAIQQYLNAGLVDEFTIHYSPVFFGSGEQLFSGITKNVNVKIKEAVASKEVTHVTFELVR